MKRWIHAASYNDDFYWKGGFDPAKKQAKYTLETPEGDAEVVSVNSEDDRPHFDAIVNKSGKKTGKSFYYAGNNNPMQVAMDWAAGLLGYDNIGREDQVKLSKGDIDASYDPTAADTYVVKIWHEIDPGHDVAAPEAAEEVFFIVANSPSQAIEWAKMRWSGPIDRIEIVDINPDPSLYEEGPLPFEASTNINADRTFYGVGGHFKHYITSLARNDVEDGQIIMTIRQFESVIEQDGFEDLDSDEIEEGFAMYQQLIDKYTDEIDGATCIQADDYLSDEDKEILRKADTSGWSEMMDESIQDEINKAGSYSNYIKKNGKKVRSARCK